MNTRYPFLLSSLAALAREVKDRIMDIVLHIGSHRTGTTSFQHFLRDNPGFLVEQKIGYWGPSQTRQKLFAGLFPRPSAANGRDLQRRAAGRIKMSVDRARNSGLTHLLISDENMIGSPRNCLRNRSLYPSIGERMARVSSAFGGNIRRIVLSVRAQDLWWSSIAAFSVDRGHSIPDNRALEQIAQNPRSWRDVITDVACAAPEAEIAITPFEQFCSRPDQILQTATGIHKRPNAPTLWKNRSPDLASLRRTIRDRGESIENLPTGQGRWMPFNAPQAAALREAYADDIMWLIAGADGLARLTEDTNRNRVGRIPPIGAMTRGMNNDQGQARLAQSG